MLLRSFFSAVREMAFLMHIRPLRKKFLKRMSARFGSSLIHNISAKEIDKAVESEVSGGPRAFNNLLGTVAAVFSYARKQGYLPRAEKTEAELVERKAASRIEKIAIYTPQEIHLILSNISEEMVPFVRGGDLTQGCGER
jgi:hypothetical protein